jgi:hypothetical protein
LKSGGYHCSIVDLKAYGNGNDFSNTRPDDRGFNPAYGAAVDVSMSRADLITAYRRVHAVWSDTADPRRKFVNAINVWDGSGDATRLNFDRNTANRADDSHKFHVHLEVRRRYLLDPEAARAVVSIFRGESKSQWLQSQGVAMPTPQEDDVALTDADIEKIAARVEARVWNHVEKDPVTGKLNFRMAGAVRMLNVRRDEQTARLLGAVVAAGQGDNAALAAIREQLNALPDATAGRVLAELADDTVEDIADALKRLLGDDKTAQLAQALTVPQVN